MSMFAASLAIFSPSGLIAKYYGQGGSLSELLVVLGVCAVVVVVGLVRHYITRRRSEPYMETDPVQANPIARSEGLDESDHSESAQGDEEEA
jgi:hypothetical protein